MHPRKKHAATWIILALTFCLTAAVAGAQEEIATTYKAADGLDWQMRVAHDGVSLRVAGPDGEVYEQSFGPGESPSLGLYDADGEALLDGSYTYELVATPQLDADTRDALDAARASGDADAVRQLRRAGQLPAQALKLSGSFTILGGAVVLDAVEEQGDTKARQAPAPKDQVFIDDLIVDGSACIGQDCVNGESFGFDTLRLKENNLRIKFDDTSNSGSFPNRDWQLTANETSNGGLNKFSIDDVSGSRTPFTIEAGAPNNSLYVDDGGRVGFGTSAPVVELHVRNGDSPTLRLEQDGSSGFTAQTWDVAGNEANFFVRDVTNGSNLPFKIIPGADDNALYVAANNDVGLGTASPDQDFDLERSDGAVLLVQDTGTADIADLRLANAAGTWFFRANTATPSQLVVSLVGSGGNEIVVNERLDGSGSATLEVDGSVEATNVTFTSTREAKTGFAALDAGEVLSKVAGLDISSWQFKKLPGVRHIGPIAEDWAEAFKLGGSGKTVSAIDIGGVALAAIQGLNQKVEELEAEKAGLQQALEARNAELRGQVEELKALVQSLVEQR